MKSKAKDILYDESKIKSLSSLEHIRLRTGMYIGRTGDGSHYDDGIYILMKEILDNSVDEFIMGHGSRIDIAIEDDTVSVRDYGRGIPLGKVIECVSKINTGGKFNTDVFQFSVGLNGVGTKAVNALSTYFVVRSHREGRFVEGRFSKGKLEAHEEGESVAERNGTFISFTPDPEIFGSFEFMDDILAKRIRYYTYLNPGLKIYLNGECFHSEGGLLDLITEETEYEKLYEPFHYQGSALAFAFTHTNRFSEDYFSFVNGQFTCDGGTHLSAFREGALKGINEYAKGKYSGEDVREGILGAVSVRLQDPVFESQTKNKLGNTEIRSDIVNQVRDAVADMLHRDKPRADRLIEKIEDTQKLRKELQTVKKLARERSKAISIRIPQLKDCKRHLNKDKNSGTDTMIFITEGQSAGGSLVSCRNVTNQAIFTLKGKPLNVCDLNRDALYKNVEIFNLMRCLDIEESVNNLRYQDIILATDADVDGLHIRNLMITFFLRFFRSLVQQNHLKILETPLYRVRNKKETRYCYTDDERVAAISSLGNSAEITRFKGLGEISPNEFKGFISDDMRLTSVQLDDFHSVPELLSFYMGKNTPERREFIMDNLIMEAVF